MPTLKLFYSNDIRRVQSVHVNTSLHEHDGRSISNSDELRYNDLCDYLRLVFPIPSTATLSLSYRDDDNEQVRITNDAELAEGFHLANEIARAAGKPLDAAVCRIHIATFDEEEEEKPASTVDDIVSFGDEQDVSTPLDDVAQVIQKWEPTPDEEVLRRDMLSLLQEPSFQQALGQVISTPKFTKVFYDVAATFQQEENVSACLLTATSSGQLDAVARVLLAKCPHVRMEIERVLQQLHATHNKQVMSTSDYFESISLEDTQEDEGPLVAIFEEDVTCPDGMILSPSAEFDKIWRLRNGGPKKWPEGCKLLCVGGDTLKAPEASPIPSVAPNGVIDVSLRMTAPATPGRYTGYWRLSTAKGTRFGQRMWVDVNVVDTETATETPVEVAEEIPTATPVNVKWVEELQSLHDMGFDDDEKSMKLLDEHEGDLAAVIGALV